MGELESQIWYIWSQSLCIPTIPDCFAAILEESDFYFEGNEDLKYFKRNTGMFELAFWKNNF